MSPAEDPFPRGFLLRGPHRHCLGVECPVYFRFAAALLLVVLVSMAGVRLEKQSLELRRAVTVQYYQTDLLLEMLVRLRLETQRLTAPSQLAAVKENSELQPRSAAGKSRRETSGTANGPDKGNQPLKIGLPLLRFRHPFNPEGID